MVSTLPIALAVKVASIIVHADELTSPGGHEFDAGTIRSLLADPEVRGWLASFPPAMLPVKRSTPTPEGPCPT